MLKKAHIKNFKAIENLEIATLSQLTLIGGKNNAGKSSLMEALAMLFYQRDPQIIIKNYISRGFEILSTDVNLIWTPLFYQFDTTKTIEITSSFSDYSKSLSIHLEKSLKRPIHIHAPTINKSLPITNEDNATNALRIIFKKNNQIIEKSLLFTDSNGLTFAIEQTNEDKTSIAYFSSRQLSDQKSDAERLGKLDINNKVNLVLEALKTIVPEISSLSVVRIADSSLIYADIGMERKIPVVMMGDGVSRLLSIILAIATSENGIVFIDEIENGIHYSVMESIWSGIAKAAQIFNCQIIATTHSHEFVSAACAAKKSEKVSGLGFSYIRLNKSENKITAKIFDYETLDLAIESDMEIR